jgi:hypothetical protein
LTELFYGGSASTQASKTMAIGHYNALYEQNKLAAKMKKLSKLCFDHGRHFVKRPRSL